MSDITAEDISNKPSSTEDGTGVFDKWMNTIGFELKEQFDDGRIIGPEYAQVYLGALQNTLQQAIAFVLQEQEAGYKADLLVEQIKEAQERIDLVIAQTAKVYEEIAASKADTVRRDLLNARQVLLVEAQIADQEYITANIRPAELDKLVAEKALIDARTAEVLASTIRNDAESAKKIELMTAQTTGFKTDAKIKLLKQMFEGRAVAVSVSGSVGTEPQTSIHDSIDDVANDILDDLASSVNIS